jgi:hypothetical protein
MTRAAWALGLGPAAHVPTAEARRQRALVAAADHELAVRLAVRMGDAAPAPVLEEHVGGLDVAASEEELPAAPVAGDCATKTTVEAPAEVQPVAVADVAAAVERRRVRRATAHKATAAGAGCAAWRAARAAALPPCAQRGCDQRAALANAGTSPALAALCMRHRRAARWVASEAGHAKRDAAIARHTVVTDMPVNGGVDDALDELARPDVREAG